MRRPAAHDRQPPLDNLTQQRPGACKASLLREGGGFVVAIHGLASGISIGGMSPAPLLMA